MKKKMTQIRIALFMMILVLPTFAWGLLHVVALKRPEVMERVDYDLGENRSKATFPERFDWNDYTAQIEECYNDHMPFRSVMIGWNRKISSGMEDLYRENFEPWFIAGLYGGKQDSPSILEGIPIAEDTLTAMWGGQDTGGKNPEEAGFGGQMPDGQESDGQEPGAQESDEQPKEEHHYLVTEKILPECRREGSVTYRCDDCGESYTEILPAEHRMNLVETVDASYQSFGYSRYQCEVCGCEQRSDFQGKPVDDSYFPLRMAGDYVILGRYNWMFYRGDSTLTYYKGTNRLSEEEMAAWLATLQRLQDVCDRKGIQLAFMLMPNKEEVYSEYMPTYEIENEVRRDDLFTSYAKENSDLCFLYPMEELKAGKPYAETYYQYDTHWSDVGGFIGVQALYEALGMPVTNLTDWDMFRHYKTVKASITVGGLDEALYPADCDYRIDYRPEVTVLSSEGDKSIFSSTRIYRAKSDSENTEKLVLVGDSFRLAMIPYLEKDFAEICVGHRDNIYEIQKDIKEADVLVITAVERYDKLLFHTAEIAADILSD